MIILWIRKNKKNNQNKISKDEKETFRQHDEVMKRFRQEHPEVELIADKDIITGDGNLLAPVQKIKLTEFVQN